MVLCALLFPRLLFCFLYRHCSGRQGPILCPVTGECVDQCVLHVYLQSDSISESFFRNEKPYLHAFGQFSRREVISHPARIAACAGHSCLYLAQYTESAGIAAWADGCLEAECDAVSCQNGGHQFQMEYRELSKREWDRGSLVSSLSQSVVCGHKKIVAADMRAAVKRRSVRICVPGVSVPE